MEKDSKFFEEALPINSKGEDGCWTWGKNRVSSNKHMLFGKKVGTGVWRVYRKDYVPSEGAKTKEKTLWLDKNLNHENGKEEFVKLFNVTGNNTPFDFPKSIELIKKGIAIGSTGSDIILDFFAGSCTTAHAVMQLNAEDGGNRKFICVQLPEPCAEKSEAQKAGFKTIADIGRERIRRAGEKLLSEASAQLDLEDGGKPDIGFRAFRLDRSNFNIWQADANKIEDLEKQLDLHVDHLNRASSPEDILYELLLKAGSPLTTKVEKHTMAGKDVYAVADGTLLICLDREITPELIEALAEARPLQVICLDKGFRGNDQLKTNAVQSFKSRAESRESETVFKTV